MNKERIEHWARHPLVVGLFSTVIFGLIVAGVGSWFQHKNWKKQEEIARQKTQQEKLFDKRTEIAAKVFYVIKKREINAWSMFGACNDPEGKSDHRPGKAKSCYSTGYHCYKGTDCSHQRGDDSSFRPECQGR